MEPMVSTSYSLQPEILRAREASMISILFAGSIGTIIEWYDFLIYGTAAALVFKSLFFPTFDQVTGTLASLGTYAVGFFGRPLGAVLFGHFGDRLGRKEMLLITISVMALGTFAIGLMPTYNQIGIWAPILLVTLRIIQGIAPCGEWGGASLMVLKHAPPDRRGLFGSLIKIGFPLGLIASSVAFTLASRLPEADFNFWGWRVPFLASIILLAVGWFLRSRVPETPLFEDIKNRGELSGAPIYEVVIKNTKNFLIAVGLKLSEVSWVYILSIFIVFYATGKLGMQKAALLNTIVVAAFVEVFTIPFFGWLSDYVGRRSLYFFGVFFTICLAYPLFWLVDTRDPAMVTVAIAVALSFGHGTMFALQSTFLPELFNTRIRYTGASFGFQASAALGGGLAPILTTYLQDKTGGYGWCFPPLDRHRSDHLLCSRGSQGDQA
jgi:MFS transporter, MHS family, shikimate and dehydroshikimate transport protein